MRHIQWRRESTCKLVLYVTNESYTEGVRYNKCKTPGVFVPDYKITDGSQGYATMQNCLKLGYTYLPTDS
ncbi:hypothetical protein [Scytonema sp. NUACC26]|uniref:hypothetical protein n=1 Tax=Scytonema sp. NUACC26 TaxID=3140176 RepID=UPI0034DBF8C1